MRAGMNEWNNADTLVQFSVNTNSKNTAVAEQRADSWSGVCISTVSGVTTLRFDIILNERNIRAYAANLDKTISAVFAHELGHVISLRDNPYLYGGSYDSLMNYIYDLNNFSKIPEYDVISVKMMYY